MREKDVTISGISPETPYHPTMAMDKSDDAKALLIDRPRNKSVGRTTLMHCATGDNGIIAITLHTLIEKLNEKDLRVHPVNFFFSNLTRLNRALASRLTCCFSSTSLLMLDERAIDRDVKRRGSNRLVGATRIRVFFRVCRAIKVAIAQRC